MPATKLQKVSRLMEDELHNKSVTPTSHDVLDRQL